MRYGNGDSYDGAWVDGRKQGTGVFILARGTKYQGDSCAVLVLPAAIRFLSPFSFAAFFVRIVWMCGSLAVFPFYACLSCMRRRLFERPS